ncbi:MAG TPA: FG-GAP-like repeat-containing protein [Terriglobia bacterium]|nr:FG-GAP-like repeat-containing protein [Terriglobia bacterium]
MKFYKYLCAVVVCLAAVLGLGVSTARAQSYLFNEAGFPTGVLPEALVSADFNGDGIPDIAAVSHQGAGVVSILLGQANATFKPYVNYPVGTSPVAVVAADFNKDGKLDLAVLNSIGDNVSVLLGKGDGTFEAQTTYPTGVNPQSMAVGDVNGDGIPDLVVANYNDSTVSVLLGNGDGTFSAQTTLPTGSNPQSVALGDIDGDGKLDIVTADRSINMASVLLGNGDGTFQGHLEYKTGLNPVQLVVGDFNHDGILDVALALAGQSDLTVLLGKGDGAFPKQETVVTPTVCTAITAGDFNGDGSLDLAVTSTKSGSVSVLLGSGSGTFPTYVSYATGLSGGSSNAIITNDFNGDGHLDLAIANPLDNNVSVLLGNSDGTFVSTVTSTNVASGPVSVATADFNGDGNLDVAAVSASDNSVSVLLGNGDGTFATHVDYPVGMNPQFVAAGDLNGDGKPDLVVANENDGTVSVLINNGDGTFASGVAYPTGTAPLSVAIADFNADGYNDLAVANSTDGTIAILLNNGDGTFGTPSLIAITSNAEPVSVVAADMDGDGHEDLVVADEALFAVSVLIGNGDGTFKPHVEYSAGSSSKPVGVAVGDFNGDGYPDVATADFGTSNVSVLLNSGASSPGTLQPVVTYLTGLKPYSIATGDLNGDGKVDLVLGNTTADISAISTLFGNGDGSFQTHLEHLTGLLLGGSAEPVAIGDFNGDNAPDVAVADQALNVVEVFLNEPVVAVSPNPVIFPEQLEGTTSSPLPVTVSNPGSAPLSIGSLSTTGAFAETNNCGSSLAVGGSCSVSVTFTPTMAGTNTGTLSITDGAPTSPQIVSLSGTATAPIVGLSPASLTFSTQTIGTTSPAQTVTLTNTGDGALEIDSVTASAQFAETNTCGASLDPNASCTISVTFTPTARGTQSGTLTLTDNASDSPQTVSLSGTGSGPAASLAPTTLAFGDQPVGSTSAPQTITLTNTGDQSLSITAITTSGPFAETNTCGATLAASGTCTISVTFTPTAQGAQNGTLTVADNASDSPQTAALSGTGSMGPFVSLVPSSVDFGTVPVGTSSSTQSVTLSNTGNGTLSISSIALTGTNSGDYSETNTCGSSVAAGKNCSITLTFKPTANGVRSASVSITDNAPASPQTVPLSGTGSSAAGAALAPASLDFGNQAIGVASTAKTVTLTNTGNATLTITSITISGGNNNYTETNTCGSSVDAAKSCSIMVIFKPTATGPLSGTLDVTDNATPSTQTVALTGTGTGPSVGLAPTSLIFSGQALMTTSASQTVTLTNGGNAALTIISIAVTGSAAAQFSATNTCGTSVAAGASCSIVVTFSPSAVGSQSAALTLTDDAANSPQSVPLSGAGAGFALGSQNSSQTVAAGQPATYNVNVTGAGGFSQTVSLTCSQSIPAASCKVLPNSVQVTSPNTVLAVVTVTTTARASVPPGPQAPSGPRPWIWLIVAGALALGARLAGGRRRMAGWALAGAMLLVLAWAGCGGSSTAPPPPTGTPAGTYTVTVKAASSTVSATTSLTLIVQ